MKKIFMLFLISLTVVSAFADDNKPKSELYGKFRFDYDLRESYLDLPHPTYGGFNVERARFGFNTMMLDNLKALLELEFKPNTSSETAKFELRIAEVDWMAADMFTLSAGRMYEAFAPKSESWGGRFDGIGALINLGMLKVAAQVGNDKSKAYDDVANHLTFMPGVIFSPAIEGVSLEVGANGKAKFTTDQATTNLSANTYACLKLAGLYALLDFDANRVDDADAMYLDLFSEINYKIDFFTPGVKVYCYNLADNATSGKTNHIDIEPYLSFEVAKGFFINPRFALINVAASDSANELTWKFTLRFEWNPKVAF
jgi:hypothetical protein